MVLQTMTLIVTESEIELTKVEYPCSEGITKELIEIGMILASVLFFF